MSNLVNKISEELFQVGCQYSDIAADQGVDEPINF